MTKEKIIEEKPRPDATSERNSRRDPAKLLLNEILRREPENNQALNQLGLIAYQEGRFQEAFELIDRSIQIEPPNAETLFLYGLSLAATRKFEQALSALDSLITLKPVSEVFFNARANVLTELGLFSEAVADFHRAIEISPRAEFFCNRGVALRELGRFDDALEDFNRAISLRPNFADAYFGRSWLKLLQGDFERGWEDYEKRKNKALPSGNRQFSAEFWAGKSNIQGKRILIHYELYLGDTIQFCRYIRLLLDRGAEVLFAPQPSLHKLMRTIDPNLKIVEASDKSLKFDLHCPLLSLPLAFKTVEKTIPNDVPYLEATFGRLRKWRKRIGEPGFKIGVCWRGSDSLRGRSFPLKQLSRISRLPNVRLISLQKEAAEQEQMDLPDKTKLESFVARLDTGPDAFLDSAAIIRCCDLVITCDTAIAHLAGALGARTWVALRLVPEWRWMLERSDSPWYPTMRLYRQTVDGDWTHVFNEMEAELWHLLNNEA